MSKSKTTTTNSTPSWIQDQVQGVTKQIQGLTGVDPQTFVADWNPFQQEAADRARSLGTANPYMDKAASMIDLIGNYKAPSVQTSSILGDLSKYMSPYTGQVVDSTLASYDKNAGRQMAQSQADQAASQAFNSSRGAIASAELGGNLALNRAQTEATLRDQGFNTGASLANQEKARELQASMANAEMAMAKQNQGVQLASLLANMGQAQSDNSRADLASILGVGNTLFDVQNANASAPLDVTGRLAQMTGAMPYNLYGTQTQTSSPSVLSSLGGLAMGIGSLASGGMLGGLTGLLGLGGSAASGAKSIANATKYII